MQSAENVEAENVKQANEAASPLRLDYLDGLRALAALSVFFYHSSLMAYDNAGWPTYGIKERFIALHHGHEAVDVFIVLSGFCLMLPVIRNADILKGGAVLFFQKRARRILPPYYIAFALSLLLCSFFIGHKTGTLWDTCLPVTRLGIAAHLLLIQDFFTRTIYQVDGPLWSISVEWRIYLAFPLLVLAWKRFGGLKATLATLAASYLLLRLLMHTPLDITQSGGEGVSPQYLGLFALGMFGTAVAFSPDAFFAKCRALPWGGISLALLALMVASFEVYLPGHREMPFYHSDYIVGLWAMSLMVVPVLSPTGLWNRFLSLRLFVFLGSFAFSIYLIHQPLLQMFWQYVLRPLGLLSPGKVFASEILVGLPIILGVCYLFHLAFERPFMSRPGTKIKTEREAEVAAVVNPAP